MSFSKAVNLLKLAEMAAARHLGVTLANIMEEFRCDYRTAQRMTHALEQVFAGVITRRDEMRRKYWSLETRASCLVMAQGLRDIELVALEMSIQRAGQVGASLEIEALERIRDRLLASMPKAHARRTEADADAILQAYRTADSPAPHQQIDPTVLATVMAALRGPFRLYITYDTDQKADAQPKLIEPYGVLLGPVRCLLAKVVGSEDRLHRFRLDSITCLDIAPHTFIRDPDFDIDDYASDAFPSFQSYAAFIEVR